MPGSPAPLWLKVPGNPAPLLLRRVPAPSGLVDTFEFEGKSYSTVKTFVPGKKQLYHPGFTARKSVRFTRPPSLNESRCFREKQDEFIPHAVLRPLLKEKQRGT